MGDAERLSGIGFGGLVVSTPFFLTAVYGYAGRIACPQDSVHVSYLVHVQVHRLHFGNHEEAVIPVVCRGIDPPLGLVVNWSLGLRSAH